MLKPYYTVKNSSETEIIINKSRFIGRAYPVETEEEALGILADIRKKHYDATHNCYAYVISGGTARYSDDGEPQGTAGMPMMEVLKSKQLTNTLVIVTRYFGGILLGAGGLVRAYSKTCAEAVAMAGVCHVISATQIRICMDYSRYNSLEPFLRMKCNIDNVEYAESVTVTVSIETEKADAFIAEIVEKTDGKCTPDTVGESYMAVDV